MKQSARILGAGALAAALLASGLAVPALARPSSSSPSPSPGKQPAVIYTPRIFMGTLDLTNNSGSLVAQRPVCALSLGGSGGPNGSLSLTGSKECAGSYYLYQSAGGSIASGVSSGTFAIVDAQDNTTVEWAGTFSEVVAYDSAGNCAETFCGDIGAPDNDQRVLLELNGFTWFVPQKK